MMSYASNRSRTAMMVVFVLFAVAVMLLPGIALAQDEPAVEDVTILVGPVEIAPDGTISVDGIVIDYSGVALPSPLTSGDVVIVIGTLVDETTLQATSFELFEDQPEDDPADEDTEGDSTEETDGDTAEDTEGDVEIVCGSQTHPVALRISEAFEDVTYDEVMALHCEGNGFGNIVRAYLLAEAGADGETPMTAAEYLELHQGGMGWGNIVRESGVHPSELAPGQIRNRNQEETVDEGGDTELNSTTQTSGGPGNGNGRGNAGGNGNGNGNKGGGNGDGNGNGHGNGNGKDH